MSVLKNAPTKDFVLGASASYANGNATFVGNGGKVDLDRAGLVGYATLLDGDSALQFGVNAAYDSSRHAPDRHPRHGERPVDGVEIGTFVNVSHTLRADDFAFHARNRTRLHARRDRRFR